MTRPKKGESLIKTKGVHLRMSETEYEILSEKAIATNMSISDFKFCRKKLSQQT